MTQASCYTHTSVYFIWKTKTKASKQLEEDLRSSLPQKKTPGLAAKEIRLVVMSHLEVLQARSHKALLGSKLGVPESKTRKPTSFGGKDYTRTSLAVWSVRHATKPEKIAQLDSFLVTSWWLIAAQLGSYRN